MLGKPEGTRSLEKKGCVRSTAEIVQSVSSVGHGLDNRGTVVRFLEVPRYFFILQSVQTAFGAHRAPYSMATRGASPAVKQPTNEADRSRPSTVEVNN